MNNLDKLKTRSAHYDFIIKSLKTKSRLIELTINLVFIFIYVSIFKYFDSLVLALIISCLFKYNASEVYSIEHLILDDKKEEYLKLCYILDFKTFKEFKDFLYELKTKEIKDYYNQILDLDSLLPYYYNFLDDKKEFTRELNKKIDLINNFS